MSAKKPLQLGDKIKTADDRAGVIRQVNTGGTAALVDVSDKDGKLEESTWFATDSLKRPRAASSKAKADDEGKDDESSSDDQADDSGDGASDQGDE